MEEVKGLTLLPPAPHKCQICAVKHAPGLPHDRYSLYYQTLFKLEHGRTPTWMDAMEHCTDQVKEIWNEELIRHEVEIKRGEK